MLFGKVAHLNVGGHFLMVEAFGEVNREDEGRRECICRGDIATKKTSKSN